MKCVEVDRNESLAAILPVLFEDDHIAIVHKPPGPMESPFTLTLCSPMLFSESIDQFKSLNVLRLVGLPTDPTKGFDASTKTYLLHSLTPTQSTDAPLRRPLPCHRLDAPTEGSWI